MKIRISYFFTALACILLAGLPMQAQQRPDKENIRKERMEKIESARTAYITDQLNLTTDQAQKFWPVYKEYDVKRKELRHRSRIFRNGNLEAMSDKEIQENINQMFDSRQAELNLDRTYAEKFLTVLNTRQLALLYKSEREFTRALLRRLEDKKASGQ